MSGQSRPADLGDQLLFAEDEHPIHQLDVLVELGREHHHRQAFARQLGEQLVEVALGADVDPAGRVVQQQDPRFGGEPAAR